MGSSLYAHRHHVVAGRNPTGSPVNVTFTIVMVAFRVDALGIPTRLWSASNGIAAECFAPIVPSRPPPSTAAWAIRLSVPRWSPAPQRPALDTRAANSGWLFGKAISTP